MPTEPFQPPLYQAIFFALLFLAFFIGVIRSKSTELPGLVALGFLGTLLSIIIRHGFPWERPWGWYLWVMLIDGLAGLGRYIQLRRRSSKTRS